MQIMMNHNYVGLILGYSCRCFDCFITSIVILVPMRTAAVEHTRRVFKTCVNTSDTSSFNMSQHVCKCVDQRGEGGGCEGS